jgi:hypothetical protein
MSYIISKLINLAGNITGILPVVNGGTGVSTSTGTTNVVLSNGPTLVAPVLGTPASGNLSNCTSYPNVTQSVAGLVASAGQLLGTNTNTGASAGNVGEYISAIGSDTFPTSGNFGGDYALALTAGEWVIDWNITAQFQGGATTQMTAFIGTATGNNTTGRVFGQNATLQAGPTATSGACMSIAGYQLLVASSTTYYLKVQASYSAGGAPTLNYAATARRAR